MREKIWAPQIVGLLKEDTIRSKHFNILPRHWVLIPPHVIFSRHIFVSEQNGNLLLNRHPASGTCKSQCYLVNTHGLDFLMHVLMPHVSVLASLSCSQWVNWLFLCWNLLMKCSQVIVDKDVIADAFALPMAYNLYFHLFHTRQPKHEARNIHSYFIDSLIVYFSCLTVWF